MNKSHKLAIVVPALSIVLASGAFAHSQTTQERQQNPPPDVTYQSEVPPPAQSDIQSEKANRKSTGHLEEYKEKDQGVPTGMETETQKGGKTNRHAPQRVHKKSPSARTAQ